MLRRSIKLTTTLVLLAAMFAGCKQTVGEVYVEADNSMVADVIKPKTVTVEVEATMSETTEEPEATIEETVPPEAVVEEEPVSETETTITETEPETVISDEELDLLARCVEAEVGNQGLTGKRLVVDVILNRVDDTDWPDTIYGVITKPYEFAAYWNGMMETVTPTEETYEAIRMELETRSYPGLYYFTAGSYSEYGTPWQQVGDHYFSTK